MCWSYVHYSYSIIYLHHLQVVTFSPAPRVQPPVASSYDFFLFLCIIDQIWLNTRINRCSIALFSCWFCLFCPVSAGEQYHTSGQGPEGGSQSFLSWYYVVVVVFFKCTTNKNVVYSKLNIRRMAYKTCSTNQLKDGLFSWLGKHSKPRLDTLLFEGKLEWGKMQRLHQLCL